MRHEGVIKFTSQYSFTVGLKERSFISGFLLSAITFIECGDTILFLHIRLGDWSGQYKCKNAQMKAFLVCFPFAFELRVKNFSMKSYLSSAGMHYPDKCLCKCIFAFVCSSLISLGNRINENLMVRPTLYTCFLTWFLYNWSHLHEINVPHIIWGILHGLLL